jgi:hypothetical protein
MKQRETKVERQYCNTCKIETRHTAIHVHETSFGLDGWYRQWDTWSIWQCLGCEAVHFKMTTSNSEDYDADGTFAVTTRYFPSPQEASLKEYEDIPYIRREIYQEVIEAFNTNNRILCSVGLRALLEGICKDQLPNQKGSLQDLIEALKQMIPSKIVDNLHSVRFLGNGAVHELSMPRKSELALAIEVVEDILNILYSLNYKSDRLYKMIEKRAKK